MKKTILSKNSTGALSLKRSRTNPTGFDIVEARIERE